MQTFFRGLFEYNHHCNQQLAAVYAQHEHMIGEKAQLLLSHMLNAHFIWNSRILQQACSCGVWDMRPIAGMADADRLNIEMTLTILNDKNMEAIVAYATSKGRPFENKTSDILFHIINHSTYHRGQIASLLRQSGIEPVATDYIFYKR